MAAQETTQPPQPRTATALRAEIGATQSLLDDALTRRADMEARRDATTRPGERARLSGDLRRLEGEIDGLRSQLAGLNAQLRLAEQGITPRATKVVAPPVRAFPVPPAPPTPTPAPPFGGSTTLPPRFDLSEDLVLGGLAIVFVLAPLAFAFAWRLIRRAGAPPVTRAELQETAERLRRIEQAVDTIAVEVERVSENQRYLTNTIASESKVR